MSGPATNEQTTVRQDPEFDFWDFVGCTVCYLPFSSTDRGPPVPFWITECGHVICNSHLNANQSCAKCGAQNIQLIPLQHNMDRPMSDWFRSPPHAIDGIAHTVKFQLESLAALVRHYRHQCLQLSSTCDRLRNERRSLRKDVESLQRELYEYRRGTGADHLQEPSAHLNRNGKRTMHEIRGQSGSVKTNSSPRSIPTPLAPLRLTLPPGNHPTMSRQDASGQKLAIPVDKPGSSRFAEQYAYHGEDDSRTGPPPARSLDIDHTMMPPPPPPVAGRVKPPGQFYPHDQTISNPSTQGFRPKVQGMEPPPIPQRPFSAVMPTPARGTTQHTTPQSNRFVPSSSHGRTFGPASAKVPARKFASTLSGQRIPFIPESSRGFGS